MHKPEGMVMYIRLAISAHVITNTLHFGKSNENCPNLKTTTQLLYIVTDLIVIVEGYFNVSIIAFANIYLTYPILVILIMRSFSH